MRFICLLAIRLTTNSECKGKFDAVRNLKAHGWVKLRPHSFLISALEQSVYLHSSTALDPVKVPSVPIRCEDGYPLHFREEKPRLTLFGNKNSEYSKMEANE